MKVSHWFITAPLLLLLVACGFHFRGAKQIPPELEPIVIMQSLPANSSFVITLAQVLKENSIATTEIRAHAGSELEILKIEQKNQQTSMTGSPQSGSYQLSLKVEIRLINEKGVVIIPSTPFSTERNYNGQITQMLSTDQQVEELQKSMYREIANQIILRLVPDTYAL